MNSKTVKYDPVFSPKVTEKRAKQVKRQFGIEVDGMNGLEVEAIVADQMDFARDLFVSPPTEKQRACLKSFGHECPPTKRQASARIRSIFDSLDFEVIGYERLVTGTQVVHFSNRHQILEMGRICRNGFVAFSGDVRRAPCSAGKLRRYRPDGDYSKTDIPKHYFENGWLSIVS